MIERSSKRTFGFTAPLALAWIACAACGSSPLSLGEYTGGEDLNKHHRDAGGTNPGDSGPPVDSGGGGTCTPPDLGPAAGAVSGFAEQYAETTDVTDFFKWSSIRSTSDGGYVVAGLGAGWNCNAARVAKLSASGDIQWANGYGRYVCSEAKAVFQTSDGGFLFAAKADTTAFLNNGTDTDGWWVVKLGPDGSVQWNKVYRSSGPLSRAVELPQGGYLLLGSTSANDAWVVKIDANGNVVWQKSLGTPGFDFVDDAKPLPGGGALIAARFGATSALDRYFGAQGAIPTLLKINDDGTVAWQTSYSVPSSSYESILGLDLTPDCGSVLLARNCTQDANFALTCTSGLLKLDGAGKIQWQKGYAVVPAASSLSYDETNDINFPTNVVSTSDGSVFLGGALNAGGLNTSTGHRFVTKSNIAIAKFGADGTLGWAQQYNVDVGLAPHGTTGATGLVRASNGGLLALGRTMPVDDTISGGNTAIATIAKIPPQDGALAPISASVSITLTAGPFAVVASPTLTSADTSAATTSYTVDQFGSGPQAIFNNYSNVTDSVTHIAP
jgi:hypothetical protein